jgi:DNA-directed RNA polymerase subunit alpha
VSQNFLLAFSKTQFYFMSDYHIALPSKPRIVSESERSGTYEIDGLFPGYGNTLGNSLRRIILSSLPGTAVTHVKIPGVPHEFSTIEGVKEDVVTILLNIRKIRLKLLSDEAQTITLSVKGPCEVTAGDLKLPGQVEVLNPEQIIAHVTTKTSFELELRAERGLGYVPKEEHQKERVDVGTIAIDAIFSPIRRANYEVENMRVGDRTNFNRLRIMIETDGTIAPREALERSIETMIHQLKAVVGFKEEAQLAVESSSDARTASHEEKSTPLDAEMLKTRITELSLPQRVEMALDNASIRTVGGLVRKREDDLLAIEGMGQKGLQDIKRALSNLGLTLRA